MASKVRLQPRCLRDVGRVRQIQHYASEADGVSIERDGTDTFKPGKVLRNQCAALTSRVRLGKVPNLVRKSKGSSVAQCDQDAQNPQGRVFLSSLNSCWGRGSERSSCCCWRGGGLCTAVFYVCSLSEYSRQPPTRGHGNPACGSGAHYAPQHYASTYPLEVPVHAILLVFSQQPSGLELDLPGGPACQEGHPEPELS